MTGVYLRLKFLYRAKGNEKGIFRSALHPFRNWHPETFRGYTLGTKMLGAALATNGATRLRGVEVAKIAALAMR
jgi:hypothetical protein